MRVRSAIRKVFVEDTTTYFEVALLWAAGVATGVWLAMKGWF